MNDIPSVLFWVEPEEVNQLDYVNSRNFLSKNSTDENIEEQIYRDHVYIEKSELAEILDVVKRLNFAPTGIGLELGSGC